MPALTCTLVADGSSDRVLIPLLDMLLDEHCPGPYRSPHFVELPAGLPLIDRIKEALDLYPCDLLFVHRDAEKESRTSRVEEIQNALVTFESAPVSIAIVPVRMSALDLPGLTKIESLPDPKQVLFDALRMASELAPNRLRKFNPEEKRHRVTDLMNSLDRLRRLPSFQHLEHQIQQHFAA